MANYWVWLGTMAVILSPFYVHVIAQIASKAFFRAKLDYQRALFRELKKET